jgi:hypothetical protein
MVNNYEITQDRDAEDVVDYFIAVTPQCLKPKKPQLLKVHFMPLGRSPSISKTLSETLFNQISAK